MTAESTTTQASIFFRLKPEASGQAVAWGEFCRRYAPIIQGFARRMGARAEEAEDAAQEVLMGFFSAVPEFSYDPAKGRFRGYLKTCTWRKLQKRMKGPMIINGQPMEDAESAERAAEALWEETWEGLNLQRALEVVRKRYEARADMMKTFKAFELYVQLERPAETVARELGMSVESVHAAKTRITKALKEAMADLESMNG